MDASNSSKSGRDRYSPLRWIDGLKEARVLVVGDVMLDRFVEGEISRISPEAPVPVLRTGQKRSTLGGAGNVVRNMLALGSKVCFLSVLGDDPEAEEVRGMLSAFHDIKANLIVEASRRTSVKTRFMAGRQQVLRVDTESTHRVRGETVAELKRAIGSAWGFCNIVVLSDYAKGVLVDELLCWIIGEAGARKKPVIVDPKGKDYAKYAGATLLTPNLKELGEASGLPVDGDEAVVQASRKLIQLSGVEAVLTTRSQDGMTLVQGSGEASHLRAEAREVFDVSGAGDTVIAVVAAAYAVGAPLVDAAAIANVAAGIVVGKVGTAVVYPQELIRAFRHQEISRAESKV
ncbi:MAG: D-glycero-beta-D-manno-heptose-7-phosphate kinase, partial [candidate division WOR-3 bacterium]